MQKTEIRHRPNKARIPQNQVRSSEKDISDKAFQLHRSIIGSNLNFYSLISNKIQRKKTSRPASAGIMPTLYKVNPSLIPRNHLMAVSASTTGRVTSRYIMFTGSRSSAGIILPRGVFKNTAL